MLAFVRTGRVAGGFLLLSIAACGGRTGGDLSGDGFDTGDGRSLPSDGGSSGANGGAASSPSTGASTSTGSSSSSSGSSYGGSTSTGQAGAPSHGGVTGIAGGSGGVSQGGSAAAGGGSTVQAACSALCLDPSSACPGQFGQPADCLSECVVALSVRGGACEGLGARVSFCLRRAAAQFSGDCATGAVRAIGMCAGPISDYNACAAGGGSPAPAPACTGNGSAAPGKCFQTETCSDGTSFSVTCYEQSPNQSNCTCSSGSISSNVTLNESAIYACNDAQVACATNGFGLK
jgi:hypothetical protein